MDIVVCPHCDSQVIGRADGTCPACQESLSSAPRATTAAAPASAPPPRTTRSTLGMMIGPVLGVVVAALFLNLSRNGTIDSMTLVSVGGALVGGIVGVLLVTLVLRVFRRRR